MAILYKNRIFLSKFQFKQNKIMKQASILLYNPLLILLIILLKTKKIKLQI